MNELDPEKLVFLKQFLIRHYVRYEDVQLELIDHLASAIEEKMEDDSSLTFEAALDYVYKSFGVGGFSKIVKEKERMMQLFWKKYILTSLLNFLKPPLLFISVAIFLLFWSIQSYFDIHLLGKIALISILGTIILVAICYKLFVREERLNKYLFLRSYFGFSFILLYFSVYLLPSTAFNFLSMDSMVSLSKTSILLSSSYLTFNIILGYVLVYAIPRGLLSKMKEQYTQLISD